MIHKITHEEIKRSLDRTSRVYLTGKLKNPQELQHIPYPGLEIGITQMYAGNREDAHYHKVQWEFVYVLKGTFVLRDVKGLYTHSFDEGDFFVIENMTEYSQEAVRDCELLFVKHPSIDDKVIAKIQDQ